ncbi:hypothetical protein TNCV_293071 [Trichonephila clavipes]|nr:hypothetical protein TNCV_293071 [Trichonephila clavipes]
MKLQSSSPTLSLYIHCISSPPTPNHPLMFCPFALPVGLGSLDHFFFCHLFGLNSFDLLSLCEPRRSRHIPSLTPWELKSRYTLYLFRRAVVTGSGSGDENENLTGKAIVKTAPLHNLLRL